MTALLRANLRAEIVGGLGIRPLRISLRPATADLLLPRQPEVSRNIVAAAAERDRAPAAFTCGSSSALAASCSEAPFSTASVSRPGRGRNGHPQPS